MSDSSPSGSTRPLPGDAIRIEDPEVDRLTYRDGEGRLRVVRLDPKTGRLSVGRGPACGVRLEWDLEVSRLHAELESSGGLWTLIDDGLSRNGTFVNGDRLVGRRRLRDGDVMRFGETVVAFRSALREAPGRGSTIVGRIPAFARLSDVQRRVLIALARPYKDSAPYATPATNHQIAEELFLSVDAVKTHLRTLFHKFGIEGLPQNRKRAGLVERAFRAGLISERDL